MSFPNPTSASSEIPVEQLSYEQAFAALESILAKLESDKQSLEEAMQLYERGQALIRRCMDLLEQAELKVQQLSGETFTDFSPQA
jgi:exodeoxyribonuclease VII small subunit